MNDAADPLNGRGKNPRIRLLFGIAMLLVGAGPLIWQLRWVRSVFAGPVPMTLAKLQELKDPAELSNPWVTLTFDEAVDTGFVMKNTMGVTGIRSHYLLIRVGNRWLITNVPARFKGREVTGHLDVWWTPLDRKVINEITAAHPNHDVLPYQLDARYPYRGECYSMLGIIASVVAIGVWASIYAVIDQCKLARLAANESK